MAVSLGSLQFIKVVYAYDLVKKKLRCAGAAPRSRSKISTGRHMGYQGYRDAKDSDLVDSYICPEDVYNNAIPSKHLPLLELKNRGRLYSKLIEEVPSMAIKKVVRIGGNVQLAMIGYPMVIAHGRRRFNKFIVPSKTNICELHVDDLVDRSLHTFHDSEIRGHGN